MAIERAASARCVLNALMICFLLNYCCCCCYCFRRAREFVPLITNSVCLAAISIARSLSLLGAIILEKEKNKTVWIAVLMVFEFSLSCGCCEKTIYACNGNSINIPLLLTWSTASCLDNFSVSLARPRSRIPARRAVSRHKIDCHGPFCLVDHQITPNAIYQIICSSHTHSTLCKMEFLMCRKGLRIRNNTKHII